jgi:hypothetical protein
VLRQGGLELSQGQTRLHGHGEIVDGVVEDPLELSCAQAGVGAAIGGWLQRCAPVQSAAEATGHPGVAVLVQAAHGVLQFTQAVGCDQLVMAR